MNDKRQTLAYKQAQQLNDAGYNVGKRRTIRLHTNPQDETKMHAHAKMAVGKILAEAGYRVDSEVEYQPTGDVADIIAYGLADRYPCIVELETEYSQQVKQQNIRKYNHGPIAEVWTLDVTALPEAIPEIHNQIRAELGL